MVVDGREDGDSAVQPLSLDAVLEILSNYQRRAILHHLIDAPGHLHSLDELIAHLSRVETQRNGEPPGEDYLLSVLVHIHGPKLQQAGLIDYDVRSGEVRYHPHERVERLLEQIESTAEKW